MATEIKLAQAPAPIPQFDTEYTPELNGGEEAFLLKADDMAQALRASQALQGIAAVLQGDICGPDLVDGQVLSETTR